MSSEDLRERLLDDDAEYGSNQYRKLGKPRHHSCRWWLRHNAFEISIMVLLIYVAGLLTSRTVTTCKQHELSHVRVEDERKSSRVFSSPLVEDGLAANGSSTPKA